MTRKKPRPEMVTRAQLSRRERDRHLEKEATRLLQTDAHAKKTVTHAVRAMIDDINDHTHQEVVEAMVKTARLAAGPRNELYAEEHKRRWDLATQIDDIAASTKRVSLAYDSEGNGGAFLMALRPKSPGYVHQLLVMIGKALRRPIDMTHLDRVKTK